jgi:hypothetical protein
VIRFVTFSMRSNLGTDIRSKTAEILDRKNIKYTSVDLVRFRWKENEDGGRKTVTSAVTIWVGVRPDSTNGDAAFHSTQDILKLLEGYGIDDLDVAYRESESQFLGGPILYAPVSDVHPLKNVIDWVTTTLSLPIAGLKTRNKQGTLGFYFKVGEDLYGVTARHVLFPDTEGNEIYSYDTCTFVSSVSFLKISGILTTPNTYIALPKKHVVLMGGRAFNDLLASIQALIGTLTRTVTILERNIKAKVAKVQGGNQEAVTDQARSQHQLDVTKATIIESRKFFATLKKDWSNPKDRVIGHVVWSPPITGLNPPHGYKRDVCVIKLDKDKFLPNLRGNAIDLGAC